MKSATPLLQSILLLLTQGSFAAEPDEIRLWAGIAPGSEGLAAIEEFVEERGTDEQPDRKVSMVTVPTITVYRPSAAMNSGTAIVICPGGGYSGVVIDKAGHEIARYLNSIGVTGIVLKYRLPRLEDFNFRHDVPLGDAARAIRTVRHNARQWDLEPDRIGVMGFSAGGHLASTIATRFDTGVIDSNDPVDRLSSRPDFQVLVYPVISFTEGIGHPGSRNNLIGKNPAPDLVNWYSNELHVSAESPPAFLVSTSDDHVKATNSLRYFEALQTVGVPAEMHIYEVGGHGYGIRPTGKPVASWHLRLSEWMKQSGLLEKGDIHETP